jgi:hypothetical protein
MTFTRGFGQRVDRGTARGAKRYIVTENFEIIDHALAKQHGILGTFFQSGAEAKRWVALNQLLRAGHIRKLRRQVPFELHVVRPDGLKVKIGKWTADHVFEERQASNVGETGEAWTWAEVVEDVKPSGGHREDLYLWKRKHLEAQYGIVIQEWMGR